jgi:hypothetical protein
MADTLTTELGLVKPEINGPDTENVWGFDLNDNFDKIDARFALLPESDAPLDGDFYGRRQGAWQRGTMHTDFASLSDRVDAVEDVNTAQDTALAGKADTVHEHLSSDVTDFAEAVDDRVANLLTAGPNITIQYDDVLNKMQISSTGTGGSGGGGLVNGDYGDITVGGFGTTMTIDSGVVTYDKIQNVGGDKLLGTLVPGKVQEITCTAQARMLLNDADAAAQRATLGLSSMATEDAANFQHADPTLTALAGLSATPGLLEQTGPDIFTKRAIGTTTASSIPTFSDIDGRYQIVDATLTALSYLDVTPGLLEQTGQDVFVKRALGVAAATSIPTRADADARYALLNSPVFTGDARCVTPAAGDNDTSIATTAFVRNAAVYKGGDVMTGPLTVPGLNVTSNIIMTIGMGYYYYYNSAANYAMSNADGNGNINFYTGTSAPALRFQISAGGTFTMQGSLWVVSINASGTVTGAAVNSTGNMSTAGTHYAGAFSAPSGTITNFNCTNMVAANNINCNNGDVAGQWRVGSLHSYGSVYATSTLSAGGAISGGYGTLAGIQCNGDLNCSNTVYITGPCYAATFVPTGSDMRKKTDLQPITNAQEILAATEVWNFQWTEGYYEGKRDYGVMAQHAIDVLPEAVHHDEEKDTWGVDYSKYVPILIAAVKELRAEILELRGELARGRARY